MSAATPLVSVIIPFYNEEQFLPETVESVLAQTYANWELLLVDDGSANNSTHLAKAFAAAHPGKIRYVEHAAHANKGAAESRNEGIRQAKGALFTFLDADDVWLPEKLAKQVAIHNRFPQAGLIIEASVYWNSWLNKDQQDVVVLVGGQQNHLYAPAEISKVLYPLTDGAAPVPSGWMLTRQAIEKSGGFEPDFHKAYQLYEDQAFLSKVYLNEYVYVSELANNLYRQRPGSCVDLVTSNGQYHTVRKFFLQWFEAYLEQQCNKDEALHSLLKKASWPYRHPVQQYVKETLKSDVVRWGKKMVPDAVKRRIKNK